MRTTYQRTLPVRLQYGTHKQLAERPNGRLSHTADTVGGPETRLTVDAMAYLRETGRLTERDATIARLLDSRKGRKTLRALLHRYRQGMPIAWPM